MIYVCNLEEMPRHVASLRPAHLVSLLEPDAQPPTPPGFDPEQHLRIEIDDITEPRTGCILPEPAHVAALLAYLERRSDAAPILFHCVAGISRSMAAALIALCLAHPGREEDAGRRLREAAPHAHPNRLVLAHADALLGWEGRLLAAREAMGPAREELVMGPLVRLGPLG